MTILKPTDFDKAVAELPILRGFNDFVNNQVGVYMDGISGFYGNKVRIERQKARVIRQSGMQVKDGTPVMMHSSHEDPTRPDVIHSRIVRTDDYIAANSEKGFNHQQLCWSIVVFLFAYWDEQIRPQIALVREVKSSDIKVDALGDLRIIRHAIIHNKGLLSASEHAKLKSMPDIFRPDEKVTLSHDEMHSVFAKVKNAIGEIVMHYIAHLPGAPDASDITSIAIQLGGRS